MSLRYTLAHGKVQCPHCGQAAHAHGLFNDGLPAECHGHFNVKYDCTFCDHSGILDTDTNERYNVRVNGQYV